MIAKPAIPATATAPKRGVVNTSTRPNNQREEDFRPWRPVWPEQKILLENLFEQLRVNFHAGRIGDIGVALRSVSPADDEPTSTM